MTPARRIAMWSGPRNISTAMMRAFENRPDCAVIDEPFYAVYLAATGADHPGRDEVIAAGDTDWRRVVAQLAGPVPGGRALWYQKHMTHHMLPEIALDFVRGFDNVFLIRDPVDVVESYLRTRPVVTEQDIGVPQQAVLFERIGEITGREPPVLDAAEVLRAPEAQLRALCARLGVDFDARMLSWPAGPRASDGIWARHWYAQVWQSTGFEPPHPRRGSLSGEAARVAAACRPHYERLFERRLRA